MAIAIRGTTPATTETVSNPVSLTLTGARQPNAGDVLLIIHFNDFYDLANMPTPTVGGSSTGVTAITNGSFDRGSSQAHAKSYTFVVGSTGDLTVSVTETGSADEEKALAVYVLSGVDTTTPIDVAANAVSGVDDTSPDAPSVSPTSTDAFLVCHVNEFGDAGTYTPPGGMTEQYDDGGSLSFTGATEQLVASGATGVKTFASSNVQGWGCLSIAVKTGGAAPILVPRVTVVAG
jgi:hypothetical protein